MSEELTFSTFWGRRERVARLSCRRSLYIVSTVRDLEVETLTASRLVGDELIINSIANSHALEIVQGAGEIALEGEGRACWDCPSSGVVAVALARRDSSRGTTTIGVAWCIVVWWGLGGVAACVVGPHGAAPVVGINTLTRWLGAYG
jgi:hypothetical protein